MEEDWDNDMFQSTSNTQISRSKSTREDEDENWDDDGQPENITSENGQRRMSEREREEELFRQLEDMESHEMRMKIKRQLRSRDDEFDDFDDEAELKTHKPSSPKRLKVSEIFGESASEEEEEPDPEVSTVDQIESVRISRNQLKEFFYFLLLDGSICPFSSIVFLDFS
ncbi:hypothetical protein RF11_07763 [Thelohanellus kitauei]|uniref:Uncharacterized protein n=1 Tax=Thelohanellus kitauei TaxID=669202 RepID=A0A0C2N838_THEKT|nr:hypothetical protein RF11_07763 [Thelohanellus kitauei]